MHGRSEVVLVFAVVIQLELVVPVPHSHVQILALPISLLDHLYLESDQAVIGVYVEL